MVHLRMVEEVNGIHWDREDAYSVEERGRCVSEKTANVTSRM